MSIRFPLLALTFLTVALASCNKDTADVPQGSGKASITGNTTGARIHAQSITAGSPSVHTVQFDINAHVVTHVPGQPDQVSDSPAGMQGAFLFNGSTVKARLNFPGTAFTDGRARIAVMTPSSNQGGVVFADTLQPDPNFPTSAVGALIQGMGGVATNPSTPFQIQTTDQYTALAGQSGSTTSTATRNAGEPGPNYITAQRTMSTSNGQITSKQYFDPQQGVVTRQTSRLTSADLTADTTTQVTYTVPVDQPNLAFPTTVTSVQTATSKRAGESAVTLDQQTDYANLQVNNLPDSYFNVGGL